MAEKKYTEHLGLTQQSEEDFVDGEEISRSFKVLDQEVFSIREKTNNLKNEDHYYSNDYYTFPEKINSITYGEGKYVAAGEYNIYSSVDKRSWNISESRSGISVAYGNGKYMAVVLHNGYYNLLASSDGTEWSEIQILVDGVQSTRKLNEIAYKDGKFVIVGDGGKIYTSDGTQVTEQSSPTSIDLKSVCFGNGIFLAIGYKTATSVLLKSSDAITWELISLSPQLARNEYEKIVFGNGIFVLKDKMRCYTTTDGTDLALHSTPEPPSGGDVCFAGNKFFLSCRTRNFMSTNGIEWTDITKEFAVIFPVTKYFNNEIIGVTDENKLIGINRYTVDGIRTDVAELNSALYPVGIVVAFVNGFNPNESLQGEWERIAKGRTLVGVNEADPDFNTAEQSGGLKDVTLSINQIPAHSHQESDLSYVYTDEHPANNSIVTTNQNGRQNINMNINSKTYTKNAGEGGSHSNLQPYFTVFYWVRRK